MATLSAPASTTAAVGGVSGIASVQLDVASLHVGQVLQAQIAELLADGSALLLSNGQLLRALLANGASLTPGQQLQLQVQLPAGQSAASTTGIALPLLRVVGGPQAGSAGTNAAGTPAPTTTAGSSTAPRQPQISSPEPPTAATVQAAVVQRAAAQAAVTQNSLAPLFADIAALQTRPLPEPLRRILDRLAASRLPESAAGLARALPAAVRNAGVFLEAKQAAPAPQVQPAIPQPDTRQADIKQLLADLVRAAAAVEQHAADTPAGTAATPVLRAPPPPKPPLAGAQPEGQPPVPARLDAGSSLHDIAVVLRQDAEAALARVELSQLASLDNPRATSRDAHYTFELPIAFGAQTGVVQFELVEERDAAPDEIVANRVWKVRFSVDTPEQGPVQAQVGVRTGTVGVSLSADRPQTLERLRESLPELAGALEAAGLRVDGVRIQSPQPRHAAAPAGHFLNRSS